MRAEDNLQQEREWAFGVGRAPRGEKGPGVKADGPADENGVLEPALAMAGVSAAPAASAASSGSPGLVEPPARRVASRAFEAIALVLLPVVMAVSVAFGIDQGGASGIIASAASLALFFLSYEWGMPTLRETMPVVVMAALAAAGRIIFAFIPSVQPMTAIIIMTGALFGRRSGFMTGALGGLVSALFLGMGAWTPWQMYSWGLIGWVSGVLFAAGAFERPWAVYVFGFVAGLMYGLVMNIWSMVAFYHPESLAQMLVVWAPAIPLDSIHGASTVVFLVLLWAPWRRKLQRLKRMYALGDGSGK